MRVFRALKMKKYLGIAILAALGIGLFLPLIQTGLDPNNVLAWYLALVQKPFNTGLYVSFSILFGLLISLQLYNNEICKTCKIDKASKKAQGVGGFGAVLGFAVGVCPACLGVIALLLPLSVSITLTNYSWVFTGIAIIIMIVSLYLLGGFRKG